MTNKPSKIVIVSAVLGIMILSSVNANLNNRIDNLDNSINVLNNNISGIYNTQDNISAKIDSIKEENLKNSKLSFSEETIIKGYNKDASTVNVDVSFGLKQFKNEDTVNVTAIGQNGKTFNNVATNLNSGQFLVALELPVQDNYILNFSTSGSTNTSGELTSLNMGEELCGRFDYFIDSTVSSVQNKEEVTIELYPKFANDTKGNEALETKEISLIVESGDEVLGKWELSPNLNMEQNKISFDTKPVDAIARIVFTDNMGIKYEQTDVIYRSSDRPRNEGNRNSVSVSGGSSSGGSSSSGSTSYPNRISEDGVYSNGYIHMVLPK